MKVRVAVAPDSPFDPVQLTAFATELEARRFDGMWLSDLPVGDGVEPVVALAYVAGITSRLKLGANVVPFGRSPARLAKDLAQIDRLSGGRLLLSLVPGIGELAERHAVEAPGDRGRAMERVVDLLRRWWAGEAVSPDGEGPPIVVRPGPVQAPLELWLGGHGPKALARVGKVADGWLGSSLTPPQAGEARRAIEASAEAAGRTVDPEHFGLSIGYSHEPPSAATVEALRQRLRRQGFDPDVDVGQLLPVGAEGLADLLTRHVDHGISKFVVRPMGRTRPWPEELAWLADVVLPLQT